LVEGWQTTGRLPTHAIPGGFFMGSKPTSPTLVQRLLLIISVVAVYAGNFWPSKQVSSAGLIALGNPEYVGFKGIFLPHLLLYSTLTALIAALFWFAFIQARILAAPQLGAPTARQLGAGAVGGIVALIASVVFVYFLFPSGTVHWIDPVPWKIAGNIFSNFYEEFVYRGFVLVALGAAIGFWPAAIIASAMWAYTHDQYPLSLQALIMAVGIYFSWLTRKARSLWTPYASHMVLDIVGDSLIG
jgi:membrane protease YdiL (CAAX protease family)